MRRFNRGLTLIEVGLAVGFVFLVGATFVIFNTSCGGKCGSVTCSETAPCTISGKVYTLGTACAPGVSGTICKKNWLFADCRCADIIGRGGVPRSDCVN